MPLRTIDFVDMPPEDLIPSPDCRRVAGFYVAHHTEDRLEERTIYHVSVWNAETGELVTRFVRIHEEDLEGGASRGAPVVGVDFSEDGRELIIRTCGTGQFDTEQEEREPLP